MGWQNVRSGRIFYRRGKTLGDVDLPILDELDAVLSIVPRDRMIFVAKIGGQAYTTESFGNWFRDQCAAAGLTYCSAHGLRKAGATRLGHRTPNEARTYIKKANRKRLADRGMDRLRQAKREQTLSNLSEKLDNKGEKEQEKEVLK